MSSPPTTSRRTAAHSITKTCETEVNPSGDESRDQRPPSALMLMSIAAWPFHRSGQTALGLPTGGVDEVPAQEEPEEHRDEDDHDRSPDELCCGELPAEEQGHDDPELDDQVRGGDLEHHGSGEVRTLAEEAPGERHCGVGARRTGDAQAGRLGSRVVGELSPSMRSIVPFRTGRLDDRGQCEPQDQRPEDLPGHSTGHRQGVTHRMERPHAVPAPLREARARRRALLGC